MENKDFIHYATHESGDYMYTTKNDATGIYTVHCVRHDGTRASWPAYLEEIQQKKLPRPGYVTDVVLEQLLYEIADQANGKTDVSSGDYFAPPSQDKSFEEKFRERIKERGENNKWEDTIEKARKEMSKDSDDIIEEPRGKFDEIAFKDKVTNEKIKAVESVVPYYYRLFYFWGGTKVCIGFYRQGEWKPKGQTDNHELLNAVLEKIDEEMEQDKKEEREAEGLPEQDTYETGLKDGKRSSQEKQKQPRFRITLEANNEALIGSRLINEGGHTKVVHETNEEYVGELARLFVDAVKGVGFQEPTVHQAVIELADEFASYDTPNGTLHEKAQQFADEIGSKDAYDWYIAVEEFKNNPK